MNKIHFVLLSQVTFNMRKKEKKACTKFSAKKEFT